MATLPPPCLVSSSSFVVCPSYPNVCPLPYLLLLLLFSTCRKRERGENQFLPSPSPTLFFTLIKVLRPPPPPSSSILCHIHSPSLTATAESRIKHSNMLMHLFERHLNFSSSNTVNFLSLSLSLSLLSLSVRHPMWKLSYSFTPLPSPLFLPWKFIWNAIRDWNFTSLFFPFHDLELSSCPTFTAALSI